MLVCVLAEALFQGARESISTRASSIMLLMQRPLSALLHAAVAFSFPFGSPALWETTKVLDSKTDKGKEFVFAYLLHYFPF